MRIAYLDCFSGISGDMFLGALVDAGVSPGLLEKTVTALRLGARLEISRVSRNGIAATKVDVWVGDEKDRPRTDLSHGHQHGQHHHHEHEHHDAGAAGPHRGLKEIREIITRAPLDDSAKETALAIFEALGAAEAKIHGVGLEHVHFHEVGAVDAIVDIVCAAVGSRALGVAEWICSPLNVGSGTIDCAHGHFPVPAPATAELLKDAPVFSSGIEAELVTPTGAAIVKVLARRFAQVPPMKIKNIGYGAGSRDFAQHANVLRVLVGEKVEVEKQHA
ncbi:MAG TPA: nickel pincer cofactor biosynthesis protein LarC, partial [Terriglobales bacterium]|nr:nickel pincer cofactor biosynthesis protein LarC [Terriglobales bacterium]